MLLSIALLLVCGYFLERIFELLRLPGLVGMLISGILLGPSVLGIVSPELLHIAPDLREIALIIILARVGLSMDLADLKSIGRPAVFMCFVPALCEIAAATLVAPLVFDISYLEAGILGCILAPVSAAVVIPRMLALMKNGYGGDKKIAQLIMAGTSVDDALVIVIYSSLVGLYQGGSFSALKLLQVPVSVLAGAVAGLLAGFLLVWVFRKARIESVMQMISLLAVSFLLVSLEAAAEWLPFSSLLAVMVAGGVILKKEPRRAAVLSRGFTQLWSGAQIMLFTLVGCAVELKYIGVAGAGALIVIAAGTVFRFGGVFLCLVRTKLCWRERLFCGISYIPKATVQAAMGAIPLSLGMASGEIILAVAVMAILLLAPLGAFLIDGFVPVLLKKQTT